MEQGGKETFQVGNALGRYISHLKSRRHETWLGIIRANSFKVKLFRRPVAEHADRLVNEIRSSTASKSKITEERIEIWKKRETELEEKLRLQTTVEIQIPDPPKIETPPQKEPYETNPETVENFLNYLNTKSDNNGNKDH